MADLHPRRITCVLHHPAPRRVSYPITIATLVRLLTLSVVVDEADMDEADQMAFEVEVMAAPGIRREASPCCNDLDPLRSL